MNRELATQGAPQIRADEREWVELEYDEVLFDSYDMALALVRWRTQQQPVEEPVEVEQSTRPPKLGTTTPELAALIWSRSLLRADEARSEADVQSFRADILDGHLLTFADVGPWVQRQALLDGPITLYVRAALPDGWARGESIAGAEPVEFDYETLEYASSDKEDEWRQLVGVARWGVLGQLRTLSRRLAKQYAWQPAQASVFVLTDATPVVSMLRSTVRSGTRQRVLLDVDPDVPADVVARAYMQARRQLLGPKPRSPSARAVELVRFAADHPDWEPARLWKQWNNSHDEHEGFRDVRALRQALADARRRVDGEPRRHR